MYLVILTPCDTGHTESKGCLSEVIRWFHSSVNWPRINLTKQIYQTCVDQWHFPQTTGSFLHTHYSELPGSRFSSQIHGFQVTFSNIKLDRVDSKRLIPSTLD